MEHVSIQMQGDYSTLSEVLLRAASHHDSIEDFESCSPSPQEEGVGE